MNDMIRTAVLHYQCNGCAVGKDTACFSKNKFGVGCGKNKLSTMRPDPIGLIIPGLPKGFKRMGTDVTGIPVIFDSFDDNNWGKYGVFNVPCWKFLTIEGHTVVRGLCPRVNKRFIHVFLEDCIDMIDCIEITNKILSTIEAPE